MKTYRESKLDAGLIIRDQVQSFEYDILILELRFSLIIDYISNEHKVLYRKNF